MDIITQTKYWRQRMVKYALKHGATATSIRYKVSRKTVHKWLKRYDGTLDSLADQSHRPKVSPRAHTEEELRKIRKRLKRHKWRDLILAYQELSSCTDLQHFILDLHAHTNRLNPLTHYFL